jgi:hypothetical protein
VGQAGTRKGIEKKAGDNCFYSKISTMIGATSAKFAEKGVP